MSLKILVVEDGEPNIKLMKMGLERYPFFNPIFVRSVEEAEEAFDKNPDLAGISMDGQVLSKKNSPFGFSEPNTLELVRKLKERFTGPIIAASSMYNQDLVRAGCTHEVENKYEIFEKFAKILDPLLQQSHGKTAL